MKKILGIVLCFVVFFSVGVSPIHAEGTYSGIGTADGNDAGADGINFSQGRVWTIDKYGKYIWVTEDRSGVHHFAFSNDLGSTWSQGSEATNFTTRGSVAYDSINDKLHVIWTTNTCDASGGIIYRRYGITRDGSNNITDIVREDSANINLQLDTAGSANCPEPVAIWNNDGTTNGTLIAIWSYENTNQTEIRASLRHLSLSAADGVAGNWVAPDGTADTFSSNAPNVSADKVYATATTASAIPAAIIRGGSGSRKNDLYIFTAVTQTQQILSYRGIYNSSNHDFSGGWQSPVTVGSMVTTSGYNAKYELITKPVLDTTNDRLYIGWARWKDNTAGDTVSMAYLSSTDTASSTIDIYSANGTHSYAPTIDIAYDQELGQLYAAYVESTTNGDNGSIDYKTYDGTTLSGSTRYYTSPGGSSGADGGADIPILFENRSNNRLLVAFRINGALPPTALDPHKIDWGYITLAQPTTAQQAVSSSSNSSTTNSASCTALHPLTTPTLFQVDVSDTEAILYFSPFHDRVTRYQIVYGYTSGDERFNATVQLGEGVLSYTLHDLAPSSTYYLKIRGMNNCMPGNFGNEMKITTAKKGVRSGIRYYKDFQSRMLSVFPHRVTPVSSVAQAGNSTCTYMVKPGDSLWRIAQNRLGVGSRFTEIVQANTASYPVLSTSSVIRTGWVLHIGC